MYISHIKSTTQIMKLFILIMTLTLVGLSISAQEFWISTSAFPNCGRITDADGNTYPTVIIETQCWMAENINVGTKINSTAGTGGQEQTDNDITEKYCYNNDISQCDIYGGLYEWHEAMQYVTTAGAQGICPEGWHIPTDAEWTTLTTFLGGVSVAGGKMKSKGYQMSYPGGDSTGLWLYPNEGATNKRGFTAYPGGNRSWFNGAFYAVEGYAHFWSSTQNGVSYAWIRQLTKDYGDITRHWAMKTYGYSVRCLKDGQ